MIKCNLAILLAERGLKMSDVINETKLAKNTVRSLYYNEAKGIQFETLTTLCDYFDVDVGELLTKLDIKVDLNSLEKLSENTYKAILHVNSGYKKASGNVHFFIHRSSEYESVELVIPLNIYQILSTFKQIEIQYVKDEVIFPILQRLDLSIEPKEFNVSVEDGLGSTSGSWLSNKNFSRRSFLAEHPF
ncbi:helix-turn-helix domain-containing protein [Brevibacillus formosus]|uniref:helix-turn-helix domain-containing protein n=1 Tax=Brevibacillus formosus TaxID=54913 RepID=UPI003F1C6EFF